MADEAFRQRWPADEPWCGPHWRPVRVCQQMPNDLQTCQPSPPGRPWDTAGRAEGGPASDEHGAPATSANESAPYRTTEQE